MLERPLVMGVINVTPDSFSDGGLHADAGAAIAHGLQLRAEGADWLDVGGESTRPGAAPVDEGEELRRVVPVVEGLAAEGIPVSIDTRKPAVARAAVAAGARLLNDVGGANGAVAAELGVAWVAMHMQGEPATMQDDPRYGDVSSTNPQGTPVPDAQHGSAWRAGFTAVPGADTDRKRNTEQPLGKHGEPWSDIGHCTPP